MTTQHYEAAVDDYLRQCQRYRRWESRTQAALGGSMGVLVVTLGNTVVGNLTAAWVGLTAAILLLALSLWCWSRVPDRPPVLHPSPLPSWHRPHDQEEEA